MAEHKVPSTESQVQRCRKLIDSLDALLTAGDWQSSFFLKTTRKKLTSLREQAQSMLTEMVGEPTKARTASKAPIKEQTRSGYTIIYISLYQAKGNDLARWEKTVAAITDYSMSRPIYANAEDIESVIRSKADPGCEAYVSVYVKNEDVLPTYSGKASQDRFGHELVTIKERTIQLQDVIEFVHEGRRYDFLEGHLKLKEPD